MSHVPSAPLQTKMRACQHDRRPHSRGGTLHTVMLKSVLTLVVCNLLVHLTSTANASARQAMMADKAANMVGVNTHLNYHGTVYVNHFEDLIKPRLIELGVRHIRDNPGGPFDMTTKQRFIDMSRLGVRVLLANWNSH